MENSIQTLVSQKTKMEPSIHGILDLRYSWWFAPGSQMTLLYRNQAQNFLDVARLSMRDNFDRLFNEPMINNLSLRITYFLDLQQSKKLVQKS